MNWVVIRIFSGRFTPFFILFLDGDLPGDSYSVISCGVVKS
jgi:hypothetical protein